MELYFQVRETLEDLVGLKEAPVQSHRHNVETEVRVLRGMIRDTGYFSTPSVERVHVSLAQKEQDVDLVNFSGNSMGNREICLEDYAAGIGNFIASLFA